MRVFSDLYQSVAVASSLEAVRSVHPYTSVPSREVM
jgi:hypothetical protein